MPRKLKVYQTSIGFHGLIIASPSMKAALEAWGAAGNLFHQGFAKETRDAALVSAAMKKPGVVLKRPVGSQKTFVENADLPETLPDTSSASQTSSRAKQATKRTPNTNETAERRASAADKRQQRENEAKRKRAEAATAKKRNRRDAAIEAAQTKLDAAQTDHDNTLNELESERAAIDKRIETEDARWEKRENKLKAVLARAKSM